MQTAIIKSQGCEVQVTFIGTHYFFVNGFFGILAVAERTVFEVEETAFKVMVENQSTLGSHFTPDAIATMVKRYINKEERKYISDRKITYDVEQENVNGKYYINVELKKR